MGISSHRAGSEQVPVTSGGAVAGRKARSRPANPRVSDERAEAERWLERFVATRDESLRERLILYHAPLVRYLAVRFANRGVPLEDLLQVGTIGLIRALDRYDPGHSAKFITYAVPTITGEIKRYFRDHNWHVKAPRRLRELNLSLMAVREEMQRETGATPSVTELAERVGVGEELALAAMEVGTAYCAETLQAAFGVDAAGAERWVERLGEMDGDFEAVELRQTLEHALQSLNPRLRRLIEMRYFDDQSQSHVARTFGISQMQVSRLERQALDELRLHLHPAIEGTL
jgi:RNA polymerase sigma-B factor